MTMSPDAPDRPPARAPRAPSPRALDRPQITLLGDISAASTERFLARLQEVAGENGDLVLELTTLGGDAEMARRIVLEIDRVRERRGGRFLFLGKTIVYSAGITIMSAFAPADRWLSADTMLMIHGRTLDKTLDLSGPMRASLPQVEALRDEIIAGLALEDQGFARVVEGSQIALDELREKATRSWYLTAAEALRRGVVAGIWAPAS